eukprot:3526939-Amphidinium_carterae.1
MRKHQQPFYLGRVVAPEKDEEYQRSFEVLGVEVGLDVAGGTPRIEIKNKRKRIKNLVVELAELVSGDVVPSHVSSLIHSCQ